MTTVQPATATTPEDQVVEIRPFHSKDLNEVRLLLGYAAMEQLARANQLCYQHPLLLSAWIGVAAVMVQIMDWWPKSGALWTWFMPLPALAACAAPFLFAMDWLNRTPFERLLRYTLSREDVLDIPSYYSQAPGCGFFVLAYKGAPIGVCAVDSVRPGEELGGAPEEVVRDEKPKANGNRKAEKKEKKGNGNEKEKTEQPESEGLVRIRHFHLDSPYRPTHISRDLLSHILQYSFSLPSTRSVYFRLSPDLQTDKWRELEEVGFKPVDSREVPRGWGSGEKRGVGRWGEEWVRIVREEWERRRKEEET